MLQSHVHDKREFIGEELARVVLGWLSSPEAKAQKSWIRLNHDAQSIQVSRIEALLLAAKARRENADYADRRIRLRDSDGNTAPLKRDFARSAAFIDAEEAINSILATYSIRPHLFYSEHDRWALSWRSARGRSRPLTKCPQCHKPLARYGSTWRCNVCDARGSDRDESQALHALLELAKQGLLERFRRCGDPECGRWFYARFHHQKFHSPECQQRFFKSSDKWKSRRAEYMRNLRRGQKQQQRRGMK